MKDDSREKKKKKILKDSMDSEGVRVLVTVPLLL